MGGMLAYTVEAGAIFAVLIAIYRHVYYGISYNKWERGYLLAATAASYLLPLLKKEYVMAPVPHPADHIIEIVEHCNEYDVVTLSRPSSAGGFWDTLLQSTFFETLVAILFAVYVLGVAVKLVSFVRGVFKTCRLMRRSEMIRTVGNTTVYNADVNTVAFSFFGNIFLGTKSRGLSDEEMDVIIRHEMQHVKGRHSIDTLVFGFFSVLQWMNPMARLAARYSRIVCENIADSQAISGGNLTEYSQLVLRLGIKNRDEAAVRKPRRKSPLVERIAQLFNTDSTKIRRVRFYAALPVLAMAVAAYIALFGIFSPTDPRYPIPIQGGYEIVAGYFNNQKICDPDGSIYIVSHPLVNLRLAPGASVAPPVESVDVHVNGNTSSYRLGTYTITIEGTANADLPLSLTVTDRSGNPIDPQLIFKL